MSCGAQDSFTFLPSLSVMHLNCCIHSKCEMRHVIADVGCSCFQISKATVSERLSDSPCALVAGLFGWTGNMERLAISNAHQKSDDPQRSYYLNQKKTLEINPRHPLIKELLRRVEDDSRDPTAKDIALMMFRTGTDCYCNLLYELHRLQP